MNQRGFTLLETLIAMLILSTGIILLSNSWSGSYMRLNKTKTINEVSYLLERKMAEIELEYRGKPLDSIPEEKEDDFGSDYPEYKWSLKSREFIMPDLSGYLTSQEGGANQTLLMIVKQMSDHISKSIKEVKVTIKVQAKPKTLEYSVVTYFIDYSKEIPMPGVGGTQ